MAGTHGIQEGHTMQPIDPQDAPPETLLGRHLLGRYEILVEIGRGGRGVVYLAHDSVLDRQVAIKLVRRDRLPAGDAHRFEREARAAAKMDHPSIVTLYDFCREDGLLFLVMPFVRGDNLRAHLRQGLEVHEVIPIALEVARALAYSHGLGIVHRDIKPENIMIQRQSPDVQRVKLVDFGLALDLSETRHTSSRELAGTFAYISPEQVSGATVDARTDIYSLGVVMYEALTGELPFRGSWQTLLYQIAHGDLIPPRERGVTLDPALENLVLRCLTRDPAHRPSAHDLSESLGALQRRLEEPGDSTHAGELDSAASSTQARHLQVRLPALPIHCVNRLRELDILEERLAMVQGGECQLILVGGPPGIGKSHLADQLSRLAADRGYRTSTASFDPLPWAVPPLTAFSHALDGLHRNHSSTTVRSRSDSTAARYESSFGPEPVRKKALFEWLARAFADVARSGPILLILEDLHRADVSIELLHYLFRRLGPMPTLIVATYQSSQVDAYHPLGRLLQRLADEPRSVHLDLQPLNPAETAELARHIVGEQAQHPTTEVEGLDALFAVTGGNPRFIEELLRHWLHGGALAQDDSGRWVFRAESGFPTPHPDFQQLVRRRLEALDAGDREFLTAAAILGRPFMPEELEPFELTDPDAWRTLLQRGFLRTTGDPHQWSLRAPRLALAHETLVQTLQDSLPFRRRRRLHRTYARHLERQHRKTLESASGLLCHHHTLGDTANEAVHFGLMAARFQLAAHGTDTAVAILEAILEFVRDDDWNGPAHPEVLIHSLMAEAHRRAHRLDAALAEAEAAHRVAEQTEQTPPAELHLTAGRSAWELRRLEDAWRWTQEGLKRTVRGSAPGNHKIEPRYSLLQLAEEIFRRRGEPEAAAEYRRQAENLCRDCGSDVLSPSTSNAGYAERLGELLLIQGDYLAARDAFRGAQRERLASRGQDPLGIALHCSRMAQLALKLGRYDEAMEHCQQGLEGLTTDAGEPSDAARLLAAELEATAGLVQCSAGRYPEAEARVQRGLDHLAAVDFPPPEASTDPPNALGGPSRSEISSQRRRIEGSLRRVEGNILQGRGSTRQAITAYETSLALFSRTDDRWEHSIALYNIAESLLYVGDYEAGGQYLDRALDEKSSIGDRWGMAYCHGARASLLLDRNHTRAAAQAASNGLQLATAIDEPKATARLRNIQARIQLIDGELDEAEQTFHLALRDAERAKAGPEVLRARLGLVDVDLERGDFRRALGVAEAVRSEAESMADVPALGAAHGALGRVHGAIGHLRDAMRHFDLALGLVESVGNPYRIVEVLASRGRVQLDCGDHQASLQNYQRLQHLARGLDDPRLSTLADIGLAEVHLFLLEDPAAQRCIQDALEGAQSQEDPGLVARVYELLARHHTQVGEYRRAETYANAAIQIYSARHDGGRDALAGVHLTLADMHRAMGRHADERQAAEQALDCVGENGHRGRRIDARRTLAGALGRESPHLAVRTLGEVLETCREAGHLLGEARIQGDRCELHRRLGELPEALRCARAEEELLRRIVHKRWLTVNAFHHLSVHFERGDLSRASSYAARLHRFGHHVDPIGRLFALELEGAILTETGRFREAARVFDRATDIAQQYDHPWRSANLFLAKARFALSIGQLAQAFEALDRATEAAQQLGTTNLLWYGYLAPERIEVARARLDLDRGAAAQALERLERPRKIFEALETPMEALDAALVYAEAHLTNDATDIAHRELLDIARRARDLGLLLRESDACLLLARTTADTAPAERLAAALRCYRLAVRSGSRWRTARAARFLAQVNPDPEAQHRYGLLADRHLAWLDKQLEVDQRRAAGQSWDRWVPQPIPSC